MSILNDLLGISEINKKLDQIMATQADLATKLTSIADQLDKAQAEIIAALEAFKNTGEVSPELQAVADRLQAISDQLDALNPDQPPAEPPPAA